MIKPVILFLILCLIFYALAYSLQRYFIYFPSSISPNPQTYNAADMQIIQIPVPDGFSISAWYKPAVDNHPTFLYLHGNGGHIGYRMPIVRQFISNGFGVLLLEYRGYGGNPGKPTEKGLYQDAQAGLKFIRQQGVPERSIIVYGESLGTGVAIQLSEKSSFCALILQSPFTSLTDLARYHYPLLLIPLKDRFDSLGRISKITVPVLILHGKLDLIVPYTQGLTLFKHANQPKQLVSFDEKNHLNLWDAHFINEIEKFINLHCTQ